jgi:hypothetical protein
MQLGKSVLRNALLGALVLTASHAFAGKPTDASGDYLGNGFPSGAHSNLNIHSKDPGSFVCPEIQYDENGDPIYGNVINIPEDGRGIEILIESGKKGPKGAPDAATLEVTDPCTGFGGKSDPATVRLPKNELGYAVYVNVTGKPTGEPTFTISDWGLRYVEDEAGNDLLLLGLVNENGFARIPADGPIEFTRVAGKSKAVPITDMFMWSGSVCYFDEPAEFESSYAECCADTDGDGAYDVCDLWEQDAVTLEWSCPAPAVEVLVYCHDYLDDTWVFNIADFVGYFWKVSPDGVKNLKVRFYPLPLN